MKHQIWIVSVLCLYVSVHISGAELAETDGNLIVLVADPHVFPGIIKRAKGFEANFQGWLNGHWHRYQQKRSPEGIRIFWLPSLGFADGQKDPITGYVLLRATPSTYDMTLIRNDQTITIPRIMPLQPDAQN